MLSANPSVVLNVIETQGDRKVTQPVLKYLLLFAVQFSWTGLTNTQYRCDYTTANAGHVVL
jgi:hypothetical protein